MMPLKVMMEEWYECEIFSIDSHVKIEDDPNFVKWVKVIYYKNILKYLSYLIINRYSIIYSNTLTIKTLLVWIFWKKTVFMSHDQVLPLKSKLIKRKIVLFFYRFFSFIRVINFWEKELLNKYGIESIILPIPISNSFLNYELENRNWWIFIWNLYFDKNPILLIEACKILKDKNIDFKINIAWEDRYFYKWKTFNDLVIENNLENYIKVLWFVHPRILKKYLSKSLCVINTSISEWQCLAVYEWALSWNFLCLQNILSFPSVFWNNAFYHNNSKELADNIIKILSINNNEIIQLNQKMILDEYNYNIIKSNTKKMFLNFN